MSAELKRLRTFHDDVVAAWKLAKETTRPNANFFFGQKLRRLVREAMERFDAPEAEEAFDCKQCGYDTRGDLHGLFHATVIDKTRARRNP